MSLMSILAGTGVGSVPLILAALMFGLAACATPSRPAIPLASVDLSRIYGDWYIVATIPNFLEKGMVGAHDVFSRGTHEAIREDFYMQRGGFNATQRHYVAAISVKENTQNGDWRVRPIWPLRIPWQVLYVDPQYRFVLFGEQNRNWGWIYSRTPTVSDAEYQELLSRFAAMGYDTGRFLRVVQTQDQIGQPGFWSDGISGNR
jgi:apolipoprotein D and lipocalin family protein